MRNLKQLLRYFGKVSRDNSPLILTTIGATGTITTAIFTARATYKAAEIIIAEENTQDVYLTNKEKFKLVWQLYIPPLSVAAVTVTSIILANRIGSKRAAAFAAAYTTLDQTFGEYREKIVEKMGESKERTARDELAQDRATRNSPKPGDIILAGKKVGFPCFDVFSGRWFMTTHEDLKSAQNNINYKIIDHVYASLNDFYDQLGVPGTGVGEDVGWTSNEKLELLITTTVTDDNEPAFQIEFQKRPLEGYFRAH